MGRIGLFSIKGRLLRNDLVKIWMCFHGAIGAGMIELFELARDRRTRGHEFKLSVPICRTELGRRTYGVRVVQVWNSLPEQLVGMSSQESFKRGLDSYLDGLLYTPG